MALPEKRNNRKDEQPRPGLAGFLSFLWQRLMVGSEPVPIPEKKHPQPVPPLVRRAPVGLPDNVPIINPSYNLDTPLMRLTWLDDFTIRDAVEGTQIFGSPGSGKTSGSGRCMAYSYLKHGFGGLVLTAKSDEPEDWIKLAEMSGRGGDVINVTMDDGWVFNFLDYELKRPQGGEVDNLIEVFMNVAEIQDQHSGKSTDPFWPNAMRQLLRNLFHLMKLTKDTISMDELHRLHTSMPASIEQAQDPAFERVSYCGQTLVEAIKRNEANMFSPAQKKDFDLVYEFIMEKYPALPDKTRGSIDANLTALTSPFLYSPWREMFCGESNFRPEDTMNGKIVLLNFPTKQYKLVARFAQLAVKYVFQQAWENRVIKGNVRPIFLWMDESHNFITDYDREFLATARSSRVATVLMTQNISNYYSSMRSKSDGKAETDALLGNIATKLFHANSDKITNEWAADSIGKSWQWRKGRNQSSSRSDTTGINYNDGTSHGYSGWQSNSNRSSGKGYNKSHSTQEQEGWSETEDLNYEVLPREFTLLRKGGQAANFYSEAVIIQAGRRFKANNNNYMFLDFPQFFLPE